MNHYIKSALIIFMVLFCACKSLAQKFTTHAVKRGETLASISEQYKVSQDDILKYNKEIKSSKQVKANTILVIPLEVVREKPVANTQTKIEEKLADPIEQEEPIGFTSYKVGKRETIYSISKRFNITEEQLKKYNPFLYSSPLKKKAVLRIPKYKRVKADENQVSEDNFETYTVAAKETRWSIAHKYGITIDSMVALNPLLGSNTNYLAEGQELRMPKKAGSSIKNQVTELFVSYVVPPKMNFFQLEKKFGVKSDEIIRLNPEIKERGGLKEGMTLRIPEKKVATGDVNTENYNFYEVKPKQTEFSLTRKLGISYEELKALNPDLQNGLKAGMVLKLLKEQKGEYEVRNALVLDKFNLIDSIQVENKPKIMFLLPFRLDKMDFENTANSKDTIDSRKDSKISLSLYSGALIALDSIASLGVSVDVKTFDNQLDLGTTRAILQKENLVAYDAIIGPLDVASFRETAVRSSTEKIPVIAPIPIKSDLNMSNLFFSYSSEEVLRRRMINYVTGQMNEENIIIIADKDNKTASDSLLAAFPKAKIVKVIEEERNIGIVRDSLSTNLSEDVENWIFVESNNYKLISSVTSILNSFHNSLIDPELSKKKVVLKMFTTNKNGHFDNDKISGSHLSNLNFTYPSVFKEVSNSNFYRNYQNRFGDSPDRYATRGFDITYDILLKLAYQKNLISVSNLVGETEYEGSKFSYKKSNSGGYFNQASYIMGYKNMRIKQITE